MWLITLGINAATGGLIANIQLALTLGAVGNTVPSYGHTASATSIAVASTGRVLSGGQDGMLFAWDALGLLTLPIFWVQVPGSAINALVIIPPSPLLPEAVAAACTDSVIRVYSASTGTLLRQLSGVQTSGIYSIGMLPDRTLMSGAGDGTIQLWNVAGNRSHGSLLKVSRVPSSSDDVVVPHLFRSLPPL